MTRRRKPKEPDAQTAEVVAYLEAENGYKEEVMAPTKELQTKLYDEIVGRIKKDDESVPVLDKGYWYYSRYEEGKEYPYTCRKKGTMDAEEEVMLDQPAMAEGHNYFAVGGRSVSPDNNLLVYGVDTVSRRQYTLYVKDLRTGELFEDRIPETTGGATWANDNKTLFYTKKDPMTLRSFQIYKHVLGTDVSEDMLVFEEKDETFSCGIGKTKSEKYLVIGTSTTVSTEWWYLDANTPERRVEGHSKARARFGVRHQPLRRPLLHRDQPRRQELQAREDPCERHDLRQLGGRLAPPRRRLARRHRHLQRPPRGARAPGRPQPHPHQALGRQPRTSTSPSTTLRTRPTSAPTPTSTRTVCATATRR